MSVLLKVENITKQFPGTLANNKINIEFMKGEVHAIIGENGAGKSTFCNILTGIYEPDEGHLYMNDQELVLKDPRQAINCGISMVYQERNLVPVLTGAQNIFLGDEPVKNRINIIDEKNVLEKAKGILDKMEVKINTPLDVPVRYLEPGHQQMIEIIRGLRFDSKLLILDEPTSSLSNEEIDVLFKVIKSITEKGTAVIFISHKLDEVFAISDKVSIFRNGECVRTAKTTEITEDECVKLMVNRDLGDRYPVYTNFNTEETILEATEVSDFVGRVNDVYFTLNKGEIVGFYGLIGSGRTEFVETLMGLRPRKEGIVKLGNQEIHNLPPKDIMAQGMFLVPEDRQENAVFTNFPIKRNLSITFLDQLLKFKALVFKRDEDKLCKNCLNNGDLFVKYSKLSDEMDSLSGGNKQKLIINRYTNQENLSVLIADEPSQGVDVGAKYDIYVLLRKLAKKGVGIVFISSELPELIGVCDRICIFSKGTIKNILTREEFDYDRIMSTALGMN